MSKVGEVTLAGTSVPVYELGDLGENVVDIVRVRGGFIPLTHPGDAAFPQLRFSTENKGTLAVHDEPEIVNYQVTPGIVEDWESGTTDNWTQRSGREEDIFDVVEDPVYNGQYAGRVLNNPSGGTPSALTPIGQFTKGTSVGGYLHLIGNKPSGSLRMFDRQASDQLALDFRVDRGVVRVQYKRGNWTEFTRNTGYDPRNVYNSWKFAELVWKSDNTVEANIFDDVPPAYPNGIQSATLLHSTKIDEVVDNFEPGHIFIHGQGYADRSGGCVYDDISISVNR